MLKVLVLSINIFFFVEIFKPLKFDFKNVKSFSWYLKGNANGNIIEIKFVDEDVKKICFFLYEV